MEFTPHVVAISGSHRKQSTTRAAVVHALAAAEATGATTELLDLREFTLPPYGGADRDAGDAPEIRQRVRKADAVILGTPIYHGSVASPLKAALDYCGFDEFEDTLVGIVVTAGGSFPGPAILHLCTIARWVNAWVHPSHVGIPNASAVVDGDDIVDPDYADRLEDFGVEMATYAAIGRLPELLEHEQGITADCVADD